MMDIESLCPLRYNQGEVKMMAVFALAEKRNIPPKTLAARLLIERINGSTVLPQKVTLPSELILRGSV